MTESSQTKTDLTRQAIVIDDDETMLTILEHCLRSEGFVVHTANNASTAGQLLATHVYDAALVDVYLNDQSGLDLMTGILSKSPLTKIFVMTAQDSVALAVSAMERGATTFLSKSMGARALAEAVAKRLGTPLAALRQSTLAGNETGLVGTSSQTERVIAQIRQVRDFPSNVLITGESGTGKELVARALHFTSSRAARRFEAINCAAIPENLLESELFGHKRGAFTDAKADRKGLFETCSGGTLFLDEIGEMPLSLQAKILRVIQDKEVRPVGAAASVAVDTRVVAATNRNLLDEVDQGRFREDLYYRLAVLRIDVPPLRSRPEDIVPLTAAFLSYFTRQFAKEVQPPAHDVMTRLLEYPWPGNVRELQNAIERAVVLSIDGKLHIEDLFTETRSCDPAPEHTPVSETELPLQHAEAKAVFERTYLEQLMKQSDGNISQAARLAGKQRADIYRMLQRHKMRPEPSKNLT